MSYEKEWARHARRAATIKRTVGRYPRITVKNARFVWDGDEIIVVSNTGGILNPKDLRINNPCPLAVGSPVHDKSVRAKVPRSPNPTLYDCSKCQYCRFGRDLTTNKVYVVCAFMDFMRREVKPDSEILPELADAFEKYRDETKGDPRI